MSYDWRKEILDISEPGEGDEICQYQMREDRSELLYLAGQRIVKYNGEDYYSGDIEDAIWEESANIIGLYAISLDSYLYERLLEWYNNDEDNLMKNVRDSFISPNEKYLVFVTGMNYAIFDKDLLGGNGNGETQKAFDDFIHN